MTAEVWQVEYRKTIFEWAHVARKPLHETLTDAMARMRRLRAFDNEIIQNFTYRVRNTQTGQTIYC